MMTSEQFYRDQLGSVRRCQRGGYTISQPEAELIRVDGPAPAPETMPDGEAAVPLFHASTFVLVFETAGEADGAWQRIIRASDPVAYARAIHERQFHERRNRDEDTRATLALYGVLNAALGRE